MQNSGNTRMKTTQPLPEQIFTVHSEDPAEENQQ